MRKPAFYRPLKQRVGKVVGSWSQRQLLRLFNLVLPTPANLPMDAVRDAQRVLIVRPNFRIGNTLLATPLILALRERFPGARLDYLCGDTTVPLLANLPVDRVYSISRRFVARPWHFVVLFVRLRRMHYDVAVGGMDSFSGGLYAHLSGARYRIGCSGKADRFLNVRLPCEGTAHAYDSLPAFARLLGASCPNHPVYQVSAEEQAAALLELTRLEFAVGSTVLPFVGVFVGGHLKKRWPTAHWIELVRALASAGARVIVFLGPEELPLEGDYRRQVPPSVRIMPPQPLRMFAALWGAAQLVVTPDSGPMHLAAALEVPAIVLLQIEAYRKYAPRGALDRVLARPSAAEAIAAVTAHPAWPGDIRVTDDPGERPHAP